MFLEILTILAILLAPVVAIEINTWLDMQREKRNRRMLMFATLMATRADRLSRDHVNALNAIDIVFYGKDKNTREVVGAWKDYKDHLLDSTATTATDVWITKQDDLLIALLEKMAICLGYDFDRSSIRKTSYFPGVTGSSIETQHKVFPTLTISWVSQLAVTP